MEQITKNQKKKLQCIAKELNLDSYVILSKALEAQVPTNINYHMLYTSQGMRSVNRKVILHWGSTSATL